MSGNSKPGPYSGTATEAARPKTQGATPKTLERLRTLLSELNMELLYPSGTVEWADGVARRLRELGPYTVEPGVARPSEAL